MATGIRPVLLDGSTTQVTGYSQNATLTVPIDIPVRDNDGPIANRIVAVAINTYKSGPGTFSMTVTIDGVTRIPTINEDQATGNTEWKSWILYMAEADLPATAGNYDIQISTGFGSTYEIGLAAAVFKNVQTGPSGADAGTIQTNGTVVSNILDHPGSIAGSDGGYLTAHSTTHNVGTAQWSHNNGQLEVHTPPGVGFNVNVALTYFTDNASVVSTFSSTSTEIGRLLKPGFGFAPITDFNVYFKTSIDGTVTVTPTLSKTPDFQEVTIAATSTNAAALLRDRGYVTTIPAVTSVTPTLVRNTIISSQTTAQSTVTVQAFNRTARLAAEIMISPVISGIFSVTRPLASTTTAQSAVSASFGSNFTETQYSPTPGDYVELFEIDCTGIGGVDIFRFIPHRFESPDLEVEWKGQTFIQFPVTAEGFEQQATGTAPPQPTLRISNVNKFVLAAVLELGDIVGAKVTRWRTYARFLDNGETPDPSAHYAPDIYYIQQKTGHTREGFEFTLSSALDLPGIKLPRRQILKDQSSDDRNLYAPGAANVRFRGR